MNYFAIPGLKNPPKPNCITIIAPHVITTVSNFYGIPLELVYSKCRERPIVNARHLVYFILRDKYLFSFKEIGRFTNKDHSTVIHAVNKMADLMSVYPDMKKDMLACRELIGIR